MIIDSNSEMIIEVLTLQKSKINIHFQYSNVLEI